MSAMDKMLSSMLSNMLGVTPEQMQDIIAQFIEMAKTLNQRMENIENTLALIRQHIEAENVEIAHGNDSNND